MPGLEEQIDKVASKLNNLSDKDKERLKKIEKAIMELEPKTS